MGTTTEKLTYLQGTKDAIKNAIVAKGVEVPEGTTFRGYAEKVGEIKNEYLPETVIITNSTKYDTQYIGIENETFKIVTGNNNSGYNVVRGSYLRLLISSPPFPQTSGGIEFVHYDMSGVVYKVTGNGELYEI